MDGLSHAGLLDTPFFGSTREAGAHEILYMEDFDSPQAGRPQQPPQAAPPPPPPTSTEADIQAAYDQGVQAGHDAALKEEALLLGRLRQDLLQTLADRIAGAGAEFAGLIHRHARETATTLFAILHAALPETMRRHASLEAAAIIAQLAPALRGEPELRLRCHPAQVDFLREQIAACMGGDLGALTISADEALSLADIDISWAEGRARRDARQIWRAIGAALAPLNLPEFEEIGRG